MKDKILFLYVNPHPAHKAFADAIKADYWYYHHYLNKIRLPRSLKGVVNGFLLPRYKFILCEGGSPLFVAAINKIINPKMKIIELIADETFEMMNTLQNKSSYKPYENWVHRITARYINGGIAVSNFAKGTAKKFINGPIKIVHPSMKNNRYKSLIKIKPVLNSYNLLSIAHYRKNKGIENLIEALNILKKKGYSPKLCLIGKNYPKELSDIEGVKVLGPKKNIVPYLKTASLYIQPSFADMFPITTLESLRAGVPVIVTNKVGTKELISKIDKKLITSLEPQSIANAIEYYFLLDNQKKIEISNKAKELSLEFNENNSKKRFKENFYELIEAIRD